MKKNWTILYGFLVVVIGLLLMNSCGAPDHETSSVASGKVIQSAVSGATVFVDINGNRALDAGEPSTTSGNDGSYTLKIPDDVQGVICSIGGTVVATGRAALPLLAPRDAKNVTSLTTLVALNPDSKAILGKDYDEDPSQADMNVDVVKIKYITESYLAHFRELGNTDESLLSALSMFAKEIGDPENEVDIHHNENLIEVVKKAAATVMALSDGDPKDELSAMETQVIAGIVSEVGVVLAGIDTLGINDLDKIEELVHRPSFAFDPTNSILPLPNDLTWAASNGKVVLDTSMDDAGKKALYTAVNKLELEGLSPNTPISVPLTLDDTIDATDFQSNIVMYSIHPTTQALTPETDFSAYQQGKFIKIYPLEPFAPGTKYLVVVKNGIKIKDSSSTIGSNALFELLKSDEALDNPSLEVLRQSYAPLFTALANLSALSGGLLDSIPASDILAMFTFTTASKTLSLTDFGVISATVTAGGDPSGMNITGLDYSNINLEYGGINAAVPTLASMSAVNSSAGTFNSFDITTLTSNPPTAVNVPYKVFNGDKYSDTIVIFQHGFTGYKEQAAAFAAKHTDKVVIAMDLPLHGDRDATPDDDTDSGSTYLTSNVGQNRINLYQSFFDMSILIKNITSGKFDFDGDSTNDTPPSVFFVGVSLGSITGSVVATNNISDLDKVILSVGGANFAALFDTAKNALLTSVLAGFNLTKDTPEYFVTLGILQLLMDPGDPVYKVNDSLGSKSVFQFAYNDTIVSNISNEILAHVADIDDDVDVTDMAVDLTTHSPYADKVYLFGGDPSEAKNWMTHGFLLNPSITTGNGEALYPEASDYLDASYVSEGYEAVNTLTSDFLN